MDPKLKQLNFKTLILSTSDFLMPRVCLCCGRQLLPGERHLCCVCLADMPFTHYEGQVHNPMANMFNSHVSAPGYERAAALFFYTGGYRKITQALKYGRNFAAGKWFASLLGEKLAGAGWEADVVCPVPLHWARRFRRGYNQAEVIGREVAKALGVPFEPRLPQRARRTTSQTRLSAEERGLNLAGAFRARSGFASLPGGWVGKPSARNLHSSYDKPLRILIIDDVFTTGATVAACDAALREAFGPDIRISVATLAFAE